MNHAGLPSRICLLIIFCCCYLPFLNAQQTVTIGNNTAEHIFTWGQVSWLEDSSGSMTFNEIRSRDAEGMFKGNTSYYPKNFRHQSVYWYKVKVNFTAPLSKKQNLIEFFDQTTDDITAFLPMGDGTYNRVSAGAHEKFENRLYRHKNFEFQIPDQASGTYVYYFRIKSDNEVNVIIVYRTITRFINHALVEYITYGVFYGMILVFCLYNFLMFLATRLKQYFYHVFYMLSVGIYEMSADGIAFQFVWPEKPGWNEYAYGIALYSMSIFALIFAKTLLQVKKQHKRFYQLINYTIVIRTVYFVICLFAKKEWFSYKFLEFIPLSVVFIAGIVIWYQGFKPARFFVFGYALLFAGAIIKFITALGFLRFMPGIIGHYSMSLGFVLEMILLSFSIGDQIRLFRKAKTSAQNEVIYHMQTNANLQASINQQLEEQVAERTHELELQSKQIAEQAGEIARMNVLLTKDNTALKTNIEKITEARIESAELTFDEFSQKYPDHEQCYKLLSDLKWSQGFVCKKCGYPYYSDGRRLFSRRCNKCAYEESPMHDTIFENNRIPINKAFYIVYLVFSNNGNISSYQIAEKLDIRQSTCWAYAIRVKSIMDQRKPIAKKGKKGSWVDLILKT